MKYEHGKEKVGQNAGNEWTRSHCDLLTSFACVTDRQGGAWRSATSHVKKRRMWTSFICEIMKIAFYLLSLWPTYCWQHFSFLSVLPCRRKTKKVINNRVGWGSHLSLFLMCSFTFLFVCLFVCSFSLFFSHILLFFTNIAVSTTIIIIIIC